MYILSSRNWIGHFTINSVLWMVSYTYRSKPNETIESCRASEPGMFGMARRVKKKMKERICFAYLILRRMKYVVALLYIRANRCTIDTTGV